MQSINKEQIPQYKYYQRIFVPSEYTNIVIGKKFKNINNIKSLSPSVNVTFITNKEQESNTFIIKSNDKIEYDRVIKNVNMLISNSYNIYKDIKKQEKENRKVKTKLREIKIRKELSKKIEKEMQDKEMEQIKSSYINNDEKHVSNKDNNSKSLYDKYKSKNPFFALEIDSDES